MKPTKSRVYCVACMRSKMLFETQEKADRFIQYNKEDIEEENGKAPVRSYYCRLCGGWHVTSVPSESATRFEKRDERIAAELDVINRISEDLEAFSKEIQMLYIKSDAAICQGRFTHAREYLKQCREMIIPLKYVSDKTYEKWIKWTNHINDLEKKLTCFTEFVNLPEEECESLLAKEDKTKAEEEICLAYKNYQTLFLLESIFEEVEDDIVKDDKEAIRKKMIMCRRLVKNHIQCPCKKSLQGEYRKRIKELCNKAKIS